MNQKISTMPTDRRTKILATLGPATDSRPQIKALLEAGANLFRINFSHASHEKAEELVGIIRDLEDEDKKPVGILADLQGPKLRIGEFKDKAIDLREGMKIRFDSDPAPGDESRVYLPHPEVMEVLEPGNRIFLDDGKVRARIVKKGKDFVEAEIRAGNRLSSKKGLNVPNTVIQISALTEKDKTDLNKALELGVDWIAQSFVQKPEDVKEARELIGDRAGLMVKLEKPAALECLDQLTALADGVMIARGDLGIEIPPEDVPALQKKIIHQVRLASKPVVVATQMLESMVESARPTRAEASDVATAVYDGADAVMLSAETATGQYPVRAVEMMRRIASRTESESIYIRMMEDMRPDSEGNPSDAITTAAYYVAHDIGAKAIVTYTDSGSTARRAARQRPDVPIICVTPKIEVARRCALSYGVIPVRIEDKMENLAGFAGQASAIVKNLGIVKEGEYFVMTAGVPYGVSGTTNILRIAKV